MTENYLRLIPDDPEYVPTPEARQMALALFSSFVLSADKLNLYTDDEIRFVDPGDNWRGVTCPVCGADLSVWWQEAAEAAYQNSFSDLTITTPCCNSTGSLNDLVYDPPAGFARFILEALNPATDVSDGQLAFLSSTLRSTLRKIWASYAGDSEG